MHSLPFFIAQGEFNLAGTVADIAEVECNPAVFPPGSKVEISDAQLFSRCEGALSQNEGPSTGGIKWVVPNEFGSNELREAEGRSITVGLDGVGNATVALVAGPHCAVGDTVISGHTEGSVVESFSASFAVMGAKPTAEGVMALPASQVEDEGSSSVATILAAEFPGSTEAMVRFAAPELYSRCEVGNHVSWLRMNKEIVTSAKELVGGTALEPTGTEAVRTDNDGNAFVIAIGNESCKPGKSYFEADLEVSPFTTEEPAFTIQPPQPTPEPEFKIEKLQEIAGSGLGFTTTPLSAFVGQTVDYEIVVTNTGSVPETFAEFTDGHCDSGTISGGPGSSAVAPGQSTTYTCTRALPLVGAYTNEASITGETVGGRPLNETSNQVEVNVTPRPEPKFTLEKLQEIAGSGLPFTAEQLKGTVGATVDYEIIVKNTGNTSLTFSEFTDAYCDTGTIAGGPGGTPVVPGASTVYTCSRLLPIEGTYLNVASVTGTPPGGPPIVEPSPPVEVVVPPAGHTSSFTLEKLQEIAGSGLPFTAEQLKGTVGATVDYEIIVKNTGSTSLTFSGFTDAYCDAGTLTGGPGGTPVVPGASTVYTCSRLLPAEGTYLNVASVTGTPPGGPPIVESSPPVEVVVPVRPSQPPPPPTIVPVLQQTLPLGGSSPVANGGVLAKCEASKPTLRGVSGPKRGPFTVQLSSLGIKRITFYLDGRMLKTLTQAQAKKGTFTLRINVPKLSYGAHRLSFTTVMSDLNCAKVAASRVFVHPHSARVQPSFTG